MSTLVARIALIGLMLVHTVACGQKQQPLPPHPETAALITACLQANTCVGGRHMLMENGRLLYQTSIRKPNGIILIFSSPIGTQRLEVFCICGRFVEITFIDTDGDGIVDHVFHADKARQLIVIYNKEYLQHAVAQDFYNDMLHTGEMLVANVAQNKNDASPPHAVK